jgi:hypothetical protein
MRAIRVFLAFLVLAIPAALSAQVRVAIRIGPPVIPVYEQPICPGDGYLWVPGYWAWDDSVGDYYWVPGTWVMAPEVGFLWTPGYWGWANDGFFWNEGFWGPTIGFYGGINYGFGYYGVGFVGGRWDHDHFFYNREVMNINVTEIHNVYKTRVEMNNTSHVSFNGGNGGVTARPTPQEEAAAHERHIAPVEAQKTQDSTARANPQMRNGNNHGNPSIAATGKAGDFEHSVVAAHGAEGAKGEAGGGAEPRNNFVHPNDLAPIAHPQAPNSGNAKADAKYQKEQDKLIANQQKERDQLQKQQDAEHKKQMNDDQKKQLEQKHQQQTQNLVQKHTTEQQSLESRMPQARPAPAPRPR